MKSNKLLLEYNHFIKVDMYHVSKWFLYLISDSAALLNSKRHLLLKLDVKLVLSL